MNETKIFNDKPYHLYSEMMPTPDKAGAGQGSSPLESASEDRQSYFPDAGKMSLANTAGVYVPVGDHVIRFVIDKNSVGYGTREWQLINETAKCLVAAYPTLSPTAKDALGALKAVVFAKAPGRSYADVEPDIFFYDTDEFLAQGGQVLISPAYAASNIVHDGYHIWLHDHGHTWHGEEAEKVCWQLQIDNEAPLGLMSHEIGHLKNLIANPGSVVHRMTSMPFG